MNKLLLVTIFTTLMAFGADQTLDQLGVKFGTDKSSIWHNYTPTYESYFEKKRNDPLVFLEIGFYRGASARMWEAYFPNAELFYIDIDPHFDIAQTLSARSHLYKVDQENIDELKKFMQKINKKLDIIVDDGGHTMKQMIVSFKTLFPYLKSGGIYVIEDLHSISYDVCHIYEDPANPETTMDFLNKIAVELQEIAVKTDRYTDISKCDAELLAKLSYYQREIKSIHFYNSMCFIFKR